MTRQREPDLGDLIEMVEADRKAVAQQKDRRDWHG
jgi:hypothetical protein